MKRASHFFTSLGTATALLFSGCSDLPPGQTGPFTDGAVVGGQFARAATVQSAESFATGGAGGTVAGAAIVILAKRQASPEQRQVAVARAKKVIAKIKTQQARTAATSAPEPRPSAPKTKAAKTAKTEKAGKAKPAATVAKKPIAKKSAPPAKRLPRYIVVDTSKDERTVPQAEKSVVIFDTETEEIVGNNVYDVKSTPPVGGTAKFETYTAEYVGSGS